MSSTERLDVLRERSTDLLNQLKQQRVKLERLSGCKGIQKRDGEDEAAPVETVTLSGGGLAPAGAALAKVPERLDTHGRQTSIQCTVSTQCLTSSYSGGTAEDTAPSYLFKDSDRRTGPANTKSCLANHSKEQKEVGSRVTFQYDASEAMSAATDRHRLQPLLGYDWIAGVLDAEDSLIERPDDFFNDLCTFRSLNKDECVRSPQAQFSEENQSVLPLPTDKDGPEANMDTHQCSFSYRINSRLFPAPLHSQECCPVCKRHKSSHPHTTAEPAHVRVSIPHSTLLPPYKYKAHRRCSFDPSDSLGLPSHCLSGWSNKGQSTLPPPSSLDLRSSLKSSNGSQSKELEELSVPKVSGYQISDVSRLVRHNFQQFSPKKLERNPYPLH